MGYNVGAQEKRVHAVRGLLCSGLNRDSKVDGL